MAEIGDSVEESDVKIKQSSNNVVEAVNSIQDGFAALNKKELSDSAPVLPRSIPASSSILHTSLPEYGLQLAQTVGHLSMNITPYLNRSSQSANYYGFVTGGATEAAAYADNLVTAYDQNVAVHLPKETIATDVEAAALNMLLDLCNLPASDFGIGGSRGSGTFTTGATASNILGLALGREHVLQAAAARAGRPHLRVNEHGLAEVMIGSGITKLQVLSTLPHSSITKAASLVGIGRSNVLSVASASDPLTVDLTLLESLLTEPHTASIVAISAGEVNTGRFATTASLMTRIRKLCSAHNAWIHVDGAFGLFGRLLASPSTEQEQEQYASIIAGTSGLQLADSITGDAHKLLNVPYDCGFFFTRRKGLADDVCRNGNAAYLATAGADDGIQSPLNVGIENSRRFRALPVYATLVSYGRNGYREMLRRQIGLARRVVGWLWEQAGYEVLPAGESRQEAVAKTFMIVLFRARDEQVNAELVKRVNGTGRIYVSGTVWEGVPAARIAVSNWKVDVERDGELIEEVLESVLH